MSVTKAGPVMVQCTACGTIREVKDGPCWMCKVRAKINEMRNVKRKTTE
jgi:hypothetical protein